MVEQRKKYDFNSVGETSEIFEQRTNSDEIRFRGESLPIGIKTPISFSTSDSSVFKMHTNFKDQILDNLRNLILTTKNERLMFPEYGANIRSLVMELGKPGVDEEIMVRIRNAVNKFMPFISLQGFEPIRLVDSNGSLEKLSMIISFSAPEIPIFNLDLEISFYEAL